MILATFETRNFEFLAIADSKESAIKLLKQAWKKHSKQYQADPDYLNEYMDDVSFTEVKIGSVMRDSEVLIP